MSKFEHEPVFTVEDAQKVDGDIDGISLKTYCLWQKRICG